MSVITNANQFFELEQYFHDKFNKQVEILTLSSSVSIVNLETYSCSCFAYSHGIKCVCPRIAKRVVPPSHNNLVGDNHNIDQLPTTGLKTEEKNQKET